LYDEGNPTTIPDDLLDVPHAQSEKPGPVQNLQRITLHRMWQKAPTLRSDHKRRQVQKKAMAAFPL